MEKFIVMKINFIFNKIYFHSHFMPIHTKDILDTLLLSSI